MYKLTSHGSFSATEFAPLNVRMKPVAGMGSSEMSTGTKVVVYSLGGLLLAWVAWRSYKEVKLQEQIVEKGGGEALMKYQLGKAADTLAFGLTRPDYRPNRSKRKKRRHGRSKR